MITKEFLKSVETFAALAPEDAEALAGLSREEVYKKGQPVFREREIPEKLYVVVSGVIEVSKSAPGDARVHRLARLERGEILGEISTFDRGPRSATASAAVVPETRLAAWTIAEFQSFLAKHPPAALSIMSALLRKMGQRLRQASEGIHTLLRALEGSPV
jgi:CRP/FNR family transcriptional regulator, cyclic AMP receptor protein